MRITSKLDGTLAERDVGSVGVEASIMKESEGAGYPAMPLPSVETMN